MKYIRLLYWIRSWEYQGEFIIGLHVEHLGAQPYTLKATNQSLVSQTQATKD